jgi:hypothetical protein
MSPRACLLCRRLNPPTAAYCYFDGMPLQAGGHGPHDMGSQAFPMPFVFPCGRACRSFAELASTSRQEWAEARGLLGDRGFRPFLALIGRNDLALAAELAASHPDPDLGLDDFLARLPGCQASPAGLEIASDEIDLGNVVVGQDCQGTLTIRNTGERLLAGLVRSDGLWLSVDTPGLQEKRFKAVAHQQLELTLHIRGRELRARTQPQVAEIAIESNGGVRRVLVRVRVPVTPFPDGVLKGAQTPRQLAEKARTALQETTRLLEEGAVARWYLCNGWTYPITGPSAKGLAAVQQYFEALGLTTPPRVELRTGELTLQGVPGQMTWGRLVVGTAEKRPVYAHAQSDQPWLTVGPMECRGPEAILPVSVATVPACPGQTLHAQLSVEANGKQRFRVPVHLHVGPSAIIEVQPLPNTGRFARPATAAPGPPLPDWIPQQPGQGILPPALAWDGPPRGPSRWWLALGGLLLVTALAAGGVVIWVVGGHHSEPATTPVAGAPPTDLVPPTTSTPPPPPTTNIVPPPPPTTTPPPPTTEDLPSTPQSRFLRDVIARLNKRDLDTNREAVEDLEVSLDEPLMRRAIPAVVRAALRQTDDAFRQRAAKVLVGLGPPLKADIDCLKEALRTPHPALRDYVLKALGEMGDQRLRAEGAGIVAEALKYPEVRREAIGIVKSLGPAARVLVFRPLLHPPADADWEAVRAALAALVELRPLTRDEIDAAAEALADVKRRAWLRCFAADLLKEAGPPAARAVPVLVTVLVESREPALPLRAIEALSRIGDTRKGVVTALETAATSHRDEKVRLEALQALKQLSPSALSTAQILERWVAEKGTSVRPAVADLLEARLTSLKPEDLSELRDTLKYKDREIVLKGLNVVRARKEEAAALAVEVVNLLTREEPEVREAAATALQAVGPAADKQVPNLAKLVLERQYAEKEPGVRKALAGLLEAHFSRLKPEEMTELRFFLQHKDPGIVRVGLNVVRARKQEAAVVAPEVANVLTRDEPELREAAETALQAIGPAADKVLLRLFDILEKRPKDQRTSLALTVYALIEARDAASLERLVPCLLDGLRPTSLRAQGEKTEAEIDKVLVKIGQPAVDGIFLVLDRKAADKDHASYRKNLYNALVTLGPSCKSKANFKKIQSLREKEPMHTKLGGTESAPDYPETYEAARNALYKMDPDR